MKTFILSMFCLICISSMAQSIGLDEIVENNIETIQTTNSNSSLDLESILALRSEHRKAHQNFEFKNDETCPWDLNCDIVINFDGDLLIMLANYGCLEECPGDFDNDGKQGIMDLVIFQRHLGQICE